MSSLQPVETPSATRSGYAPGEVRRSLWFIILAWVFGAGFFALATGATFISFVKAYLHADDMSFGFIMAAGPAAVLFQFLGSYLIERTGKIKAFFIPFVIAHRLLWLAIAAVAYWAPVGMAASRRHAIVLAGVIAFASAALANFGGAGWAKWMGEIVPTALAGKLFGYRARLGMIAMIVMSVVATTALDRCDNAGWVYAVIFAGAAILGAIDIALFVFVREAPRPRPTQTLRLWDIVTTPWQDTGFRDYVTYTALAWISYTMMGPFLWPYCFAPTTEHGLGLSTGITNIFLFVLPLLANAWVAPYWGAAIDRFGPRPVFAASSISACIMPIIWVVMRPEWVWLVPVQCFLAGLFWPGIERITDYMLLKGFPEHRRSTYVATFNVVFGLATMIGPALGGLCAAGWKVVLHHATFLPAWLSHYHLVFLTSMLARTVAFIYYFPRRTLSGDASSRTITQAVVADTLAAFSPRHRRKRTPHPAPQPVPEER